MTSILDHALSAAPDTTVAKIELGLDLYLADTFSWAETGARMAFEAFLQCAPTARLNACWIPGHCWQRLPKNPASLGDLLTLPWGQRRPRHLFELRVVDDPGAPTVGFVYREIDRNRASRAGHLSITLPQESQPAVLERLTRQIAGLGSFYCGVGGYVARLNETHASTASGWLYKRCRRWLGIDIARPDLDAWQAPKTLCGFNWMTLVGRPLAEAVDLDERSWGSAAPETATLVSLDTGWILRASAEPTLGDVHRLVWPHEYSAAARHLRGYIPPWSPQLGGGFAEQAGAIRWRDRFVAPTGWS